MPAPNLSAKTPRKSLTQKNQHLSSHPFLRRIIFLFSHLTSFTPSDTIGLGFHISLLSKSADLRPMNQVVATNVVPDSARKTKPAKLGLFCFSKKIYKYRGLP
jgi:hypothetical protein